MSGNGDSLAGVTGVLRRTLQLGDESALTASTRLLGGIPEFDSLAVATVVIGLEEHFNLEFDDEDINAELFETVGTLAACIDRLRQTDLSPPGGPQPGFVEAASGSLYVILNTAAGSATRCVVYVAPFAEEMNRARKLITSATKSLNEAGLSCCNFDLFGTGDSDGEFADARWPIWLADLHDVVSHLRARGFHTIDLIGIRLGAPLALQYANTHKNEIARILFWDPVFDGRTYLNRFLRTRTMAAMMSGKTESVKDLLALLHDGTSVEVGGYALHPELATAVAGIAPTAGPGIGDTQLIWITRDTSEDTAALAAVMGLHPQAIVKSEYDPYWASAEPTEAAALIEATRECLLRAVS